MHLNLMPWRQKLITHRVTQDLLVSIVCAGILSIFLEIFLMVSHYQTSLLLKEQNIINKNINKEKKLWLHTKSLNQILTETNQQVLAQNHIHTAWINLQRFLNTLNDCQIENIILERIHCENTECELTGKLSHENVLTDLQNSLQRNGYKNQLIDWHPMEDHTFYFKLIISNEE